MSHRLLSQRSSVALLVAAVVALALLVPAVALAVSTPSVTIVGPGLTPTPTVSPTAAALAVHESYVDLHLQDNGWGADQVRFSNDGGVTWSDPQGWSPYPYWGLYYDLDVTQCLDGPRTLTAQFSKDGGATWEASATATTLVDTQMPVVRAPEGYWNNHYPYQLSAHDQIGLSGVESLWYRVDTGALEQLTAQEPLGTSSALTASVQLAGETGTAHSIDFLARDYAGNYSSRNLLASTRAIRGINLSALPMSAYVIIDRTPPTVKVQGVGQRWRSGPVVLSFSAKDAAAGLDRIEYSITGFKAKKHASWTSGNSVVVNQLGRHKVWYRAVDQAQPEGNASAAKYVVVKIRS
jgi:hypothetical protein